jgi:hypothetical protein
VAEGGVELREIFDADDAVELAHVVGAEAELAAFERPSFDEVARLEVVEISGDGVGEFKVFAGIAQVEPHVVGVHGVSVLLQDKAWNAENAENTESAEWARDTLRAL